VTSIRQLVAEALKRKRFTMMDEHKAGLPGRARGRDSGVLLIVAIGALAIVLLAFVLLMMR
jgi:hypothetical protein